MFSSAAWLIARLPRYSHISYYIKEHLHWLPISTRIEYKVLLIVFKAHMRVAPKYICDATRLPTSAVPHLFVRYAPWTCGSFLSLGLRQPWPCLDLFPLFPLLFGIAFHLQLVFLSYHTIFLRPYQFLKLVSFLGANQTKSACLPMAVEGRYINTWIQCNTIHVRVKVLNTVRCKSQQNERKLAYQCRAVVTG